MKLTKIQKILEESNKVLPKLTDKQYEQYSSKEHKKQFRKRQSKGGNIAGPKHYENGTGLFAMSQKKKKEAVIKGGKIQGNKNVETGQVIKAGKISAKSPKHPNNTLEKCIHCGFKTTLPLIRRWHNDNCKHK
jgi:hypothetical protein